MREWLKDNFRLSIIITIRVHALRVISSKTSILKVKSKKFLKSLLFFNGVLYDFS